MKCLNTFLCTLFSASVYATHYAPWFPPPLEFQGRVSYHYTHANQVTSPLDNFPSPTCNSSLHTAIEVTPWPFWNVEAELYLTHTHTTAFNYEALLLTGRYAWLDDIAGDPFTLVTGATLSFPGTHFLHEFSFPYHGHANLELHTTIGKEWTSCAEWRTRLFALAGFGIAEKGSPWFHGLVTLAYRPFPCLALSLFTEALYGFGHNNIVPFAPFPGYASINHQNIDLGASLHYYWGYFGTLTLTGWHQVHAHNFIDHAWGFSLALCIPFSVI